MILTTQQILLYVIIIITHSTATLSAMYMEVDVLCFHLGGNRQVESYSAHGNMDFFENPKNYEGSDILNMFSSYTGNTREDIVEQFNSATKDTIITESNYEFNSINHTIEIMPLVNQMRNSYFVRIWPTIYFKDELLTVQEECYYLDNLKQVKSMLHYDQHMFDKNIFDILHYPSDLEKELREQFNATEEENIITEYCYPYKGKQYKIEIVPLNNTIKTHFFLRIMHWLNA